MVKDESLTDVLLFNAYTVVVLAMGVTVGMSIDNVAQMEAYTPVIDVAHAFETTQSNMQCTYVSFATVKDKPLVVRPAEEQSSCVVTDEPAASTYASYVDVAAVDAVVEAQRRSTAYATSVLAIAGDIDRRMLLSVPDMADIIATPMLSVRTAVQDAVQVYAACEPTLRVQHNTVDTMLAASGAANTVVANQPVVSVALASSTYRMPTPLANAYVMTLPTDGVSSYSNYPNGSIAEFGGNIYTTDENGNLYVSSKEDDVPTKLVFDKLAATPGVSRWDSVWFDTDATDMTVGVTTDANVLAAEYDYPVVRVASHGEHNARGKVGRGLFGRYATLSVRTLAKDYTLRAITLDVLSNTRRT